MPDSASLSVLAAFYARLSGDATLVNLVRGEAARITSAVPEGAGWDRYVLIGESFELPDRTFGRNGHDEMVTVHCYAEDTQDESGWDAVGAMNNRVVQLLDDASLSVSGHNAVYCSLEESARFDDGPQRRVSSDFRVVTEDT